MSKITFEKADVRLANIFSNFKGQIAVLVDENTEKYCLPLVQNALPRNHVIIQIKSGEVNKSIETCMSIWENLTNNVFHRTDVLLNLGGGVIGDMGGFCAATYKRGIDFYTIPTTLLSQVDASVGGKLGIDFNGFKNQIGLFQIPKEVIVDPRFLKTLDKREIRSGYAEVIKHNLINPMIDWQKFSSEKIDDINWEAIIPKSIKVKTDIVDQDFKESGERKKLNFGHTIGHAIESHFLNEKHPLLHGEAIAAGMVMESWISTKLTGMKDHELSEISTFIFERYDKIALKKSQLESILQLIKMDKKNRGDTILMTLLEGIGSASFDNVVTEQLVSQSFEYYNSY